LGTGGASVGRLQVLAVGGIGHEGGTGVREEVPITEHARVLGRRSVSWVVRLASGLGAVGHTHGGQDGQAAVRSGVMQGGLTVEQR
jgi:hypothetical protein